MNPEYDETSGLNHCLRVGARGFTYEPELGVWTHDYWTPEGFFAQHTLTAEEIHDITWAAQHRVTVWGVPE